MEVHQNKQFKWLALKILAINMFTQTSRSLLPKSNFAYVNLHPYSLQNWTLQGNYCSQKLSIRIFETVVLHNIVHPYITMCCECTLTSLSEIWKIWKKHLDLHCSFLLNVMKMHHGKLHVTIFHYLTIKELSYHSPHCILYLHGLTGSEVVRQITFDLHHHREVENRLY